MVGRAYRISSGKWQRIDLAWRTQRRKIIAGAPPTALSPLDVGIFPVAMAARTCKVGDGAGDIIVDVTSRSLCAHALITSFVARFDRLRGVLRRQHSPRLLCILAVFIHSRYESWPEIPHRHQLFFLQDGGRKEDICDYRWSISPTSESPR